MPSPALICESCSRRIATFDRKALVPEPTVRVTTRPDTEPGVTVVVFVCACGCRRPWRLGNGYEVKAGAGVVDRRAYVERQVRPS